MRYFTFLLFIFSLFPFYSPQIEKSIEKEKFLLNSGKEGNPDEMKDLKMPENQIPQGINQNWFSEVQKNIEKEEYNITYQDEIKILNGKSAYQAPNRAQGFRTYFTKEGIIVIPRTEEEPAWEFGLSLQNQKENQNQDTNIYVEENRIEIDKGWIKEWYVNSKEGLEQGFTINNPVGAYSNTPLQIDLKLSGNLRPVFSEDGKAVDFYKDGGFNVLHYGSLIAKDVLENELEGKFEPISGGIRISIDDEGAVYPIVIDPLFTTPAWTGESNQAGAYFGWSVSTAGDVNGDGYSDVIVGAYLYDNGESNEGRTFLYLGNEGLGFPVKPMQIRSDYSRVIPAGGKAYEQGFRISLNLRSPFGRGWAKLEWQALPHPGSFSPVVDPRSSSRWWNTQVNGVRKEELVDLSEELGTWMWRARIRYYPSNTPFQPHSRWYYISDNAMTEADLKSVTDELPPACVFPDEPCWLYSVVKVGIDITLNWQDPNQADQRTGWNIRRSNNASLPKNTWPMVGSNVVDMDQSTPNYQWTDHSGDDPGPGGIWYYQVTTYNLNCPAEGPF